MTTSNTQMMAKGHSQEVAPGRYASVNGLNMYYEVHGSGRPLVLLHGALSAIGIWHVALVDRAELLLAMIPPFLDAPMPEASS